MVILTNNWIIIDSDDSSCLALKTILTKRQGRRTVRLKNGHKLEQTLPDYRFYEELDNKLYIPVGILSYISKYIENSEIIDKRSVCDWEIDTDIKNYVDLLPNIELRNEQLIAIRKAIVNKRGILQLPTGSGKTEIMCGIIELVHKITEEYKTTLILEPTIGLVKSTIKRFQKYNIPVTMYNDNREIIKNTVNICHPSALGNDLKSNNKLLNDVEILLGDESHHFSAEQFRKPTYNIPNLKMSIGVSASAISYDHINCEDIRDLDIKEVLIIGATGNLLMSLTTDSLINKNRLSEPVLMRLKHIVTEPLPEDDPDPSNWHNISKIRLESNIRNKLIVDCTKIFSDYNRKSLILVRTVRWARLLLKQFYDIGLSDIVASSYGGGRFEIYDGNEYRYEDGILEKFEKGNIKILIGTTHLYEGVDIPNLDVIVLGYGGKGERTQIQGIGRALRLTKTGKYAYIVDFTDDNDLVLSKHSRIRLSRYKNQIGIPDNRIFNEIDIRDVRNIFKNLENIEDV